MRKIIWIALVAISTNAMAQLKVNDRIMIWKGDLGNTEIHIDAEGTENNATVVMNQKKALMVAKYLQKIKPKFEAWRLIAEKDTIEYVKKEFKNDPYLSCGAMWVLGNTWFSASWVTYTPYFRVNNGVAYISFENYKEIVSSGNQFIKMNKIYLNFYSVKEIDEFINGVNKENIQNIFDKQKKDSAKFK